MGSLLKHQSAAVRVHAAQAIAAFGSEATQYMTELESALDTQTDDVAKKTIAGVLATLRIGRSLMSVKVVVYGFAGDVVGSATVRVGR